MYDVKSMDATQFIDHAEVLASLEFGESKKNDKAYLLGLVDKAKRLQRMTHREAAALILCDDPEILNAVFAAAHQIKEDIYGKRIVLFAPLYLSNYCVNGCRYCAYHYKNDCLQRRKLTQDEIRAEVKALEDMGHKRLALEAGEDPNECPLEYILESIKTVYDTAKDNGVIRRVNVNIAATTVENYQKLKEAGIGTYILFQETYNQEKYEYYHPTGPKHNYRWHTEAMDRAMQGGIDDVGIGVLFGLYDYRYEMVAMLMHIEHLEAVMGVGPHTISVPRLRPAEGVSFENYPHMVSDDEFKKIVALLRVFVPYTGLILSTRETPETRKEVIQLGISQVSGGSCTGVGGYCVDNQVQGETHQFDVSDERSLDEVLCALIEDGYVPSFCTACYRQGRTGDRFMQLAKAGQIQNVCLPNALITFQEYLSDYAPPATKAAGEALIEEQIPHISNEKVRQMTADYVARVKNGERDFRF